MTASPPFHLQPVLSELYHSRDLLDFSAPGPSSPPRHLAASPTPPSSSLFSSATSIAAAAGRRAAAIASPSSNAVATFRNVSPERGGGAGEGKSEVRCVEGYGGNMYIGGSDGVVEWWVCDGTGSSIQSNGWTMRHKHTLFPRRPVSKIILLPKVSKALILSDGTLHPVTLPNLEPVPSTVMSPLRGVVDVVLDDDELDWGGVGSEDKSAEMVVVVVRRKGLGVYRLGTRLVAQKEIPLPSPPTHSALFSTYLCTALPSSGVYSIIDLSDASLTEVLPVSQIDSEVLDFDPNPNVVVIPGENEFLVTSYTGVGSMGVFLNGQGDPVRGTMEWEDHPLSIAIESGFIIALLRNHTVVVHSLNDLEKPVQKITLDSSFGAFTLSYSPYGISTRDIPRDERMIMAKLRLLGGKLIPPSTISAGIPAVTSPETEEPPSGSGLTPPSSPLPFTRQPITPQRGSSLVTPSRAPFSTSITETLVIGPNGVLSISPTPTILKLEALCAERKLAEATQLVDEERRKGRRGEIDGDRSTHQATMRLLHLYLACHLLLEASFESAGDYFLRGKVDPRLLVRLYPRFRGKVIGSAEDVEVYQGLLGVLADMPIVDDLIGVSIRRNYSPHVSPSVDDAPETLELKRALEDEANVMLTEVLRKTRQSRRKGGARGVDSRKIDIVIDTTLAKLLAEAGTTNELLALLAGTNDCVLSELEPFLEKRPYVLATVMRQQGRIDRVLEILQGIAENVTPDPLCSDPVDEIAQQLDGVKDVDLFKRYLLWLVSKDVDKALSILIAQNPKTGIKLDDAALIEDLRAQSEEAAYRYLEHVVVVKKSPNRQLHENLLTALLDEAIKQVEDDGVKYHLEELDAEYRLEYEPRPFCVFLAHVAPDTPVKTVRLKLMLFLQASPFLDLGRAAERLMGVGGLKPELAVVLGRLGKNREALQLLARDIGDSLSAQTYCTQGGEIIPPRVARTVASHVPELAAWAVLGEIGRKRRGTVDGKTQEGLVMELLGVYMRDGASTAKQSAALLNAQSLHLDVLDVLELMPSEWPLDVVSSFFQRSIRRQQHERASWQVLKAISAGQNLETSEEYLDRVRSIPPLVVHGPSPGVSIDMSQPDEGSIAEKEYGAVGVETGYDEKGEGEKGVGDEAGEKGDRGFFSPEVVDKELAGLGVVRGGGESDEGLV